MGAVSGFKNGIAGIDRLQCLSVMWIIVYFDMAYNSFIVSFLPLSVSLSSLSSLRLLVPSMSNPCICFHSQ